MRNRKPSANKSSIYKGVHLFKPTRKYSSHIRIEGKKIHLGYFHSEIEAAIAYDNKALELFGEFARLNIIKNK